MFKEMENTEQLEYVWVNRSDTLLLVPHLASSQIFIFHPRVQWSSLTHKKQHGSPENSTSGISLLLLLLLENADKGNFA